MLTLRGREATEVEVSSFSKHSSVVNLRKDSSIANSVFLDFLARGCLTDASVGLMTAIFRCPLAVGSCPEAPHCLDCSPAWVIDASSEVSSPPDLTSGFETNFFEISGLVSIFFGGIQAFFSARVGLTSVPSGGIEATFSFTYVLASPILAGCSETTATVIFDLPSLVSAGGFEATFSLLSAMASQFWLAGPKQPCLREWNWRL